MVHDQRLMRQGPIETMIRYMHAGGKVVIIEMSLVCWSFGLSTEFSF